MIMHWPTKRNPQADAFATRRHSTAQAEERAMMRQLGSTDPGGGMFAVSKVTQDKDATCWVRHCDVTDHGWLDPKDGDFGRLWSNHDERWT